MKLQPRIVSELPDLARICTIVSALETKVIRH